MVEAVLVVAALAAGVIGALVGAGGGFILVPVLLFLYPDDPPHTITMISLSVVLASAASGSIAYARQRRIDYRTAFILAFATIPGAAVGALLTRQIDRGLFIIVFSVVLTFVAGFLFFRPTPKQRLARGDSRWLTRRSLLDRGGEQHDYAFPMIPAFGICLIIGLLSSLLGVGGGIFQVPIFILVLGFPAHIATATSSLMLVATSSTGVLTHLAAGDTGDVLVRILLLVPGVIIGAQIGAALARRTKPRVIARTMAIVLLIAAVRLFTAEVL
jgi:uncharacterized protein